MTVVIQHQFFNLQVLEDRFQVELSFDNIPEKLVIPFASVKGFLDPAVQFGLQFEVASTEEALVAEPQTEVKPKAETKPKLDNKPPKAEEISTEKPNVVSLDAFRKK